MDQFLWMLDERNVEQVLISSCLTGEHQPLDVGVNKPFKEYYRAEYHKWRMILTDKDITQQKNYKHPNRQELVNFVSAA
jgi:DDE superfamily endonuclease